VGRGGKGEEEKGWEEKGAKGGKGKGRVPPKETKFSRDYVDKSLHMTRSTVCIKSES